MTARRTAPIRRDEIVKTALNLARVYGYEKVTRDQIGKALGLTGQGVMHHFDSMGQLRRHVMRAAVRHECLPVIAQGIIQNDPAAKRAPEDLQERALASVLTNEVE